jgi:hypothetical protein
MVIEFIPIVGGPYGFATDILNRVSWLFARLDKYLSKTTSWCCNPLILELLLCNSSIKVAWLATYSIRFLFSSCCFSEFSLVCGIVVGFHLFLLALGYGMK